MRTEVESDEERKARFELIAARIRAEEAVDRAWDGNIAEATVEMFFEEIVEIRQILVSIARDGLETYERRY